jgi:predicted nicotinamide N-methyase
MSNIRVKYQTIEFDNLDLHIRILRDSQQFDDPDNIAKDLGISSALWPLFGQIWPSGIILANLMSSYEILDKRILEVGCGIGLASLVLNNRMADITSTDYHPSVENFLDFNTKLNEDRDIPYIRTGWEDQDDELGKFDLIIGSDLLYEPNHSEILSNFINDHSKKNCEVIIIDPNRGYKNKFTKEMDTLGFDFTQVDAKNADNVMNYKGKVITYNR